MANKPTSFAELNKADLVAAAKHFGTAESGTAAELRIDLVEGGVTWNQYAKAFNITADEAAVQDAVEEEEVSEVITVTNTIETAPEPVTVSAHPILPAEKNYLVKMTRENPYFEFGAYRFTQDKPYAIMGAVDAQAILSTEEGFRQAFPSELDEFYD